MQRKNRFLYSAILHVVLSGIGVLFLNCEEQPSPPLSPGEALESFVLAEEDVIIELAASEPLVQDPVAITFDAAGRLWVVEMLGFMTDIDGTGEEDPAGRVSVLFDDDGDGQMDRSTIFLDSLVLPRAIALVKEGILISENIPLWLAKDTDGDFKADAKILIDSTYGGSGMPEHSGNGLWRGLDNWLYNAKSKFRYKYFDGEWIKDETEFRGQWGIVHDDAGRLFYNYNWSQLHADLVPPNALLNNRNHSPTSGIDHGLTTEREIFPIRSNTAVNRGYVPGTLDEQGRLLEFASACGPLVYRGDDLPDSYKGNAFVCEPTANLIKRNYVTEEGFMLGAEGAYKDREFLASSDERFRPISLASGPDGAMYVVDMYKGIIQHGPYMTDYLREVTLERQLDKPIHMGRIWRITSKKEKNKTLPDLSKMTPADLVNELSSENGWTRDMAQRLLVEKGDVSVLDDLKEVVVKGRPLGKLHALWTLEGLGHEDPEIFLEALKAKDPVVAQTALRLVVNLASDQPELKQKIEEFLMADYDRAAPILQMQMVIASSSITSDNAFSLAEKFLETYGEYPVARDVVMSSLEDREEAMLTHLLSGNEWREQSQNKQIFFEMLASAIVNKGKVTETDRLFAILQNKKNPADLWIKTAIANGMGNAERKKDSSMIMLKNRPALFEDPDGLSAELQPLLGRIQDRFSWPGKRHDTVPAADRAENIHPGVFAVGRQKYLNLCANCHGMQGEGMRRFAPPLKNSEWVTGEDYKLAMILLHGMEGPVTVDGKLYDTPDILPSMPSFTTLQNEDIAAIATYIRNSWGNSQSEISPGTIGRIRYRTQGKIQPWTASELDTVAFDQEL